MRARYFWTTVLFLVACSAAVTAPTVQVIPSVSPVSAQSTTAPSASPTPDIRTLPSKFEQIGAENDLPLPQDGPGMWRFYDQEAQVVCYVYGATRHEVLGVGTLTADFSWSGLSCLPASQTALGK